MEYEGITLTPPNGQVSMTHSVILDYIQRESSTKNMDWFQTFLSMPWGRLKDKFPDDYFNASKLSSLANMDYQVCNGGIWQYFDNGYHKDRGPYSEHDVEQLDIEEQKKAFKELVHFANTVYPERRCENSALGKACDAFQKLFFEEDAEDIETFYCDEDEYIWDEEGNEIQNPDYFEPYDERIYTNIIRGNENDTFDDTYYTAAEYLEEMIELFSQYNCKLFAKNVEPSISEFPEIAEEIQKLLPHDIAKQAHPLTSILQGAKSRAVEMQAAALEPPSMSFPPER